jgi:hypothetical protein
MSPYQTHVGLADDPRAKQHRDRFAGFRHRNIDIAGRDGSRFGRLRRSASMPMTVVMTQIENL